MMDFAALSPQHIVIRKLQSVFGAIVYEDELPLGDTHWTSAPIAIVVNDVGETVTARTCSTTTSRMLVQATIYQRCDDCRPGFLMAIERRIEAVLSGLDGTFSQCLRVGAVTKQSSVSLPYVGETLRARAATFAFNYSISKEVIQ